MRGEMGALVAATHRDHVIPLDAGREIVEPFRALRAEIDALLGHEPDRGRMHVTRRRRTGAERLHPAISDRAREALRHL